MNYKVFFKRFKRVLRNQQKVNKYLEYACRSFKKRVGNSIFVLIRVGFYISNMIFKINII